MLTLPRHLMWYAECIHGVFVNIAPILRRRGNILRRKKRKAKTRAQGRRSNRAEAHAARVCVCVCVYVCVYVCVWVHHPRCWNHITLSPPNQVEREGPLFFLHQILFLKNSLPRPYSYLCRHCPQQRQKHRPDLWPLGPPGQNPAPPAGRIPAAAKAYDMMT